MQVVILAGGLGTRLMPLTTDVPKPMVQLQGRPFLHYQLAHMKAFGISKFLLLVGYLGEKIIEYFGDGTNLGIDMEYSHEPSALGTGGALKYAQSKLENQFILLNGDTLLPINYQALVDYFHKRARIALICAYDNRKNIVPNNLCLGVSDQILEYNGTDPQGMTHVDAGAAVYGKEVLDLIPAGKPCSLEQQVYAELIAAKEVLAFPVSQRFYDMGTFKGMEALKKYIGGKDRPTCHTLRAF